MFKGIRRMPKFRINISSESTSKTRELALEIAIQELTGGFPHASKMPVHAEKDLELMQERDGDETNSPNP